MFSQCVGAGGGGGAERAGSSLTAVVSSQWAAAVVSAVSTPPATLLGTNTLETLPSYHGSNTRTASLLGRHNRPTGQPRMVLVMVVVVWREEEKLTASRPHPVLLTRARGEWREGGRDGSITHQHDTNTNISHQLSVPT